jgi:hypothetical protein
MRFAPRARHGRPKPRRTFPTSLIALALDPAVLKHTLLEMVAFAARYGHQPLSEIGALRRSELQEFCREVGALLQQESNPRGGGGE